MINNKWTIRSNQWWCQDLLHIVLRNNIFPSSICITWTRIKTLIITCTDIMMLLSNILYCMLLFFLGFYKNSKCIYHFLISKFSHKNHFLHATDGIFFHPDGSKSLRILGKTFRTKTTVFKWPSGVFSPEISRYLFTDNWTLSCVT